MEAHYYAFFDKKVYLNQDNSIYTQGEDIWAKVNVLNGRKHETFDAALLVCFDWIVLKSEVLQKFTLCIKGGSEDLVIPTIEKDSEGRYLIRGYTRH